MTIYRINAGKYKHKVTFQRLAETQDSYGEVTSDWVDAFEIKAGIFPNSGRDVQGQYVIQGEVSHRVHIRYIKGVDSEMRILFGNRVFDIVSPPIDFQERHLELQLLCKERKPLPTGG
jgi:SPP1 family predicted phage head-tail adaptor